MARNRFGGAKVLPNRLRAKESFLLSLGRFYGQPRRLVVGQWQKSGGAGH